MHFAFCLFFFLFPSSSAFAQSPPFAVQGATWRIVIHQKTAPNDPDAGTIIEIPAPDLPGGSNPNGGDHPATAGPFTLLDAAGQPLPVAVVSRAPSQNTLLLARDLKPGQDYFVYLGGTHAPTDWRPKTSLLLETRVPPANNSGPFTTLGGIEDAWENAAHQGAGFADSIFLGDNPYGEQDRFLSRFVGYLRAPPADTEFYTNSSDASFVLVNGLPFLEAPGNHGPMRGLNEVHGKKLPPGTTGTVRIDYFHAKTAPDGPPIMALCWVRNGHPEAIPADAWLHPGTSEIVRAENARGQAVPRPEITVESYMGWDGEFLYEVRGRLLDADPAAAATEWRFDDGGVFTGPAFERVMAGTPPEQRVTIRVGADANAPRVVRRLDFGGPPPRDVGNPPGRRRYLDLLARQDPATLDLATLDAVMPLLLDNGLDARVAPYAAAWLRLGPPVAGPHWLAADVVRLQALAETNPKAALTAIRADTEGRAHYGRRLDLLEADVLVFRLRDPGAAGRVGQIAFGLGNNTPEGRLAAIRLGDLARLTGDPRTAAARYTAAQPPDPSGGRKLPAEDQANSITVQNLLEHHDRQDAMDRLKDWELAHPMAKLTSDFLLQRGRALQQYGRWNEALTELESLVTVQPDSPYQIEADFHRARAMYELGRKDEAHKIWADIIKNYPKSPLAEPSREWVNKP